MIPKPFRAQSAALRESARGRACTLRLPGCDGGGETTVLAHIRGTWTGLGTKPSDLFGIFCCFACHDRLDGRQLPRAPAEDVLRAVIETQTQWLAEGYVKIGRS